MKTFFPFTVSLLLAARLGAQSLTVDWFTVDGGGGASSDGSLTIAGTAGQPDAGVMSDGTLTVQGGFWPAFTATSASTGTGGYKVFYSTQSATPNLNFVGVVNSDGSGNAHVLDTACWPRVSRDGSKMLYHPVTRSTGNFAQNDLAVYNFTSSNSTTIFGNSDYVVYYDWLVDGTNVVFDYGCGMYRWNASNGSVGTIFNVDCYDDAPSVNPVDGSLAFHNAYQGLMMADANGANRAHLPNTQAADYWPNWSPDGQWLTFANPNGYWKIKADGTGRTNLWSNLSGVTHVKANNQDTEGAACFSPDGQWVIAPFVLNGTMGIYALAADGSGTVKPILTGGLSGDQVYNFIGGMWPADLKSLGTPPGLTISASSPGQATISWTPATPGFVLQESDSLAPANWSNSVSGAQNPVTVSTGSTTKFYRLVHP